VENKKIKAKKETHVGCGHGYSQPWRVLLPRSLVTYFSFSLMVINDALLLEGARPVLQRCNVTISNSRAASYLVFNQKWILKIANIKVPTLHKRANFRHHGSNNNTIIQAKLLMIWQVFDYTF